MRRLLPILLLIIACGGTPLSGLPLIVCPTPPMMPPPTPVTLPAQGATFNDTVIVDNISFRPGAVETAPLDSGKQVALWTLTITNGSDTVYQFLPTVQLTITAVDTPDGTFSGTWWSTGEAAQLVDAPIDRETLTIAPGMTTTAHFAAIIPTGTVGQLSLTLDPSAQNSTVIHWQSGTSGCGG